MRYLSILRTVRLRHPEVPQTRIAVDDRHSSGRLSTFMPYVSDQVHDDKTRQAIEAAIVTLAACTYAIAFPMLHRGLGPGSGVFAILPVVLASWFWGFRVGVASALIAGLVLNPVLLLQIEGPGGEPDGAIVHSIPYFLAILVVAAATGRIRDYRLRLRRIDLESRQRRLTLERETREQVEELLMLKSAFLNNMSHELRTPLTAILGFAEILVEEIGGTHREFAERILSSGIRLHDTLNSVLDFAQLEGGTLKLDMKRLDVGRQVRAAASCCAAAADRKGLEFTVRVPHEPVESELDLASLHRIVKSLVENAVKFTAEGVVAVDVSADESRTYVRVCDTGIGISESFLPHMFKEFRQESVGHARSYEGSGLGLSVTKRLVDLLGGCISVESRRGEGSTFTVSFPRIERPVLEILPRPTVADMAAQGIEAVTHVLVLDDSSDTLALTQHQLRDRFVVKTAGNAESALDTARKNRFDALVLDVNLGAGHDGIDVLRALRQLDAYRTVPVIALTAYSMPGDRDRFLEAGFDAYLSKPFTKQQIIDTLDLLLDTRSAA